MTRRTRLLLAAVIAATLTLAVLGWLTLHGIGDME